MFLTGLLIIVIITLIITYFGGIYNENYWKKRGVAFYGKNKFFGVFWDFLFKDRAFFENLHEIYKENPDEPAVGMGCLFTKTLYVKDPKNIQYVLISEFNAFSHIGFETNENDLLAKNILFLNGNKWKLLRQSMSPLFTASKLRSMYCDMDKSAQDFISYIKARPNFLKGNTYKNLAAFCSAAIGSSLFGVTIESIFDSPFLEVADKAFLSVKSNIKIAFGNLSITLFKLFGINLFKEYEELFIGAIKTVISKRKTENVKKHDFVDACVHLQSKGPLKDPEGNLEIEPTDELMAAQAFFFFVAGVHPTAAVMFGTLVELGRNPEALERLHKEIDEAFDKCNGKISYDIVKEMTYLDMTLSEGMRLYPPIGYLTRMCVRDTVLPVGNIKVSKGTKIFTPVFELQHDPKYFPNPEEFIPERFLRENKNELTYLTYMPFGKGGRICIGMRYAHFQAKAGLIHLLRNFTVKTNNKLEGGRKYIKDQIQVRLKNVDVDFLPRK